MIIEPARRPLAAMLMAALAASSAGCGHSGATGSTEEATVKGTVRVNGKALTRGTITFSPANINRKDAAPRTAPIGPDGTYTNRTLVGGNGVSVGGPEVQKFPGLEHEEQTYFVESGERAFDLNLNATGPGGRR